MITENKIVTYYSDEELRTILEQRKEKRKKDFINDGFEIQTPLGGSMTAVKFVYSPHEFGGSGLCDGSHFVYSPSSGRIGTLHVKKV